MSTLRVEYEGLVLAEQAEAKLADDGLFLALAAPMPVGTRLRLFDAEQTDAKNVYAATVERVVEVGESGVYLVAERGAQPLPEVLFPGRTPSLVKGLEALAAVPLASAPLPPGPSPVASAAAEVASAPSSVSAPSPVAAEPAAAASAENETSGADPSSANGADVGGDDHGANGKPGRRRKKTGNFRR